MNLALLYILFSITSILINLAAQEVGLFLYSGQYSIAFSIFCGTGAGLVAKYVLDKNYIFKYRPKVLQNDLYTFIKYTGTGVLTTFIFWGFEFGFELIFANKFARYTGAVIGLSIGYIIKYQLDKRLVFNTASQGAA